MKKEGGGILSDKRNSKNAVFICLSDESYHLTSFTYVLVEHLLSRASLVSTSLHIYLLATNVKGILETLKEKKNKTGEKKIVIEAAFRDFENTFRSVINSPQYIEYSYYAKDKNMNEKNNVNFYLTRTLHVTSFNRKNGLKNWWKVTF